MKTLTLTMIMGLLAITVNASPMRVVLLDCIDESGERSKSVTLGTITAGHLAEKGAYMIGKELVKHDSFVMIDRRNFTSRLNVLGKKGDAKSRKGNGMYLQAAQALKADAVLRKF